MNATIKNEVKNSPANFSVIWKSYGATISFSLGLAFLLTGIILTIFAFFEKTSFDKTEIALIISSFVLFGLGAHCLDLLEMEKKAKRGNL